MMTNKTEGQDSQAMRTGERSDRVVRVHAAGRACGATREACGRAPKCRMLTGAARGMPGCAG